MSVDTIKINGQPYVLKRAILAAAATANETLVAAVTGKKIRVLAAAITGSGAAAVRFESTSGGTALTPVIQASIASNIGNVVLPFNEHGWFETVAGELLNLERTGVGTSGVAILYVEA